MAPQHVLLVGIMAVGAFVLLALKKAVETAIDREYGTWAPALARFLIRVAGFIYQPLRLGWWADLCYMQQVDMESGLAHAGSCLVSSPWLLLRDALAALRLPFAYQDGERPICVARRHVASFIPHAVVWVAALAVALGVLHLQGADHPVAVALVLAVASGVLISRGVCWHYRTYHLTNQRLIITYGVRKRVTESLSIRDIKHTAMYRGLIARRFGYGDIVIRSASKGDELRKHIADVDSFSLALITAMSGAKDETPDNRFTLPPLPPPTAR
jgi:membrane protein YdbS with pleckstrin-like domain